MVNQPIFASGHVVHALWLLAVGCASLDRTPPEMVLALPDAPVAGVLELPLEAYDERPGLASLSIQLDAAPAVDVDVAPTAWTVDTTVLDDGPHRLIIRATDAAFRPNLTESTYDFTVDNSPPSLEVARRTLTTRPGHTWPIVLRIGEATEPPSVTLGDDILEIYPLGDHTWRALTALPLETEPGSVELGVRVADALGNAAERRIMVSVMDPGFAKGGYIRLSSAQAAARRDSEAIERMRAERAAAYTTVVPEQLWTAPMSKPTDGRLTSTFGKYRSYSDGRRSFHTGTDYGAARGTPVRATARGRVVLAREQAIFGNVVVLAHGQGVTTSYNHMTLIEVEEGAIVERGTRLGTVGNTGQSTGPHLHWGMVVGGVHAADATDWLDDDFSVFDDFVSLSP